MILGAAALLGPWLPAAVSQADAPAAERPDPSTWMNDPEAAPRAWLDKPLIDAGDLAARLPLYEEVLASHGILLDTEGGSVAVRGAVLHDPASLAYPVEYLVVTELGRTHEAVLLVKAQPSVLNACLRVLGLEPGSPTTFELLDPPAEEGVDSPDGADGDGADGAPPGWRVHPASGPVVSIGVAWVDDAGVPHDVSLESMLIDVRTGAALADQGWIFTGSGFTEYRKGKQRVRWFRADVEGDVVAIYLAGTEVCLLERNSLDGLDDTLYFLNADVVPPRGTPITMTLRVTDMVVPVREPMAWPPAEPGGPDAAPSPPGDG